VLLTTGGRTPRGGGAYWEQRLLAAANPGLSALVATGRALGPVRGGVLRVPRLGVVVTDAVLIREVLKDYRSTSLLGEGGVGHLWTQVLGDWVVDSFDGPGHVDLRRRSRDLFTEANAAEIVGPVFDGPVGRAVRVLEDGGVLDVAALARELVGRMVVALLGLRLPDLADDDTDPRPYLEVYAAGERLASLAVGTQASTHLSAETVARARTLVGELTRDVPQAFRESGPDTLLGRCREMGLSERESTGLATLLLVAGTETAASAMGRTVALLADTGQVADVVAAPALVPDAVREGLRVSTPAPVIGRNVVRDTTIGRLPVRAGERVVLLTYVADNVTGPFDVHRPYDPSTRQLWFGAGRHLCLGAPVARAEIAHVVGALAGTGRRWRVVRRDPARRALIPTYARLDVALV
jgi:cytochrome P450